MNVSVSLTTPDTVPFLRQGGKLRRATYSSSVWSSSMDFGASYSCRADKPALVVTRAKEAAKFGEGASGWSGYSILTNNCETFACWCSTGRCVLCACACFGCVWACVFVCWVEALWKMNSCGEYGRGEERMRLTWS